jgi:hypothetical protein
MDESSAQEEEVIEIEDNDVELVEHHPSWLIQIYTHLWHKTDNYLTLTEIFSRVIDPESPRWYMLPIQENNAYSRIRCWSIIRKV